MTENGGADNMLLRNIDKVNLSKCYIFLTVHLGIILVNNRLDALISMYSFISLLYTFRATQCSSSGESNCINTSSGMYHSV